MLLSKEPILLSLASRHTFLSLVSLASSPFRNNPIAYIITINPLSSKTFWGGLKIDVITSCYQKWIFTKHYPSLYCSHKLIGHRIRLGPYLYCSLDTYNYISQQKISHRVSTTLLAANYINIRHNRNKFNEHHRKRVQKLYRSM